MQRFFLTQPIAAEMEITGADAHHIGRVLRMKPGEYLSVSDPQGQTAVACILKITAEKIVVKLEATATRQTEPPVRLWLAQGLPKADKLEFIVQKAVELGAAGIIPVQTDNTVVRYDADKARSKVERWRKIAAEAAKQSGRQCIPPVDLVHDLKQVLDRLNSKTLAIMPYEQESAQTLGKTLEDTSFRDILILIGPEGGFTPEEVELCRARGVKTVTLGPRILRTETAALAVLAIVMYQCGDLGSQNR